MKLTIRTLALALGMVLGTGTGADALAANDKIKRAEAGKRVPGQYIVVLADQRTHDVPGVAHGLTKKYGGKVDRKFSNALKGFSAKNLNARQLEKLAADPAVAYVEEDAVVSLNATQTGATWGLDRIDQPDLPLDGSYTYPNSAGSVHSYIIDTGIRTSHSEFSGRTAAGYTAISDGNGTNDCNGHGTHVAGTVGGTTYGVAKSTILHPVRVLNCQGSGTNSGVIAGVDWVAANYIPPAVANMSLGGGASTALDTAIANAVNSGVTMVVAAGNENQNACNVSPAREASAVTVASSTSSDGRSSFSNWGSCVDIFAPGSSITSAWHTSNSATNTISGTSMASPHVAGAAALYLENNQGASPIDVTNALLAQAASGKISGVNGSPNLLLQVAGGTAPPPPPPPGGNELANGETRSNLSGSTGSFTFYTINVPAGASDLNVTITGGSGDADLYVKFGSQPTTSSYDCRPYRWGNEETCSFATPQAGTYHIGIRGYEAYSGVSLTASYTEPSSGGNEPIDVTLTNLSGTSGAWDHYTLDLGAGYSSLTVSISGGSGDADLYVRHGAQPTTSSYDCRPYRWGNNETCTFTNPAGGTWYISLRAYSSYSGVTLQVTAQP